MRDTSTNLKGSTMSDNDVILTYSLSSEAFAEAVAMSNPTPQTTGQRLTSFALYCAYVGVAVAAVSLGTKLWADGVDSLEKKRFERRQKAMNETTCSKPESNPILK